MTLEEVKATIQTAFPPKVVLGDAANRRCCDECRSLADSVSFRSWDELDRKTLDREFGGLSLLTMEAYVSLLPAWLMFSLEELNEEDHSIREWTLFSIACFDVSESTCSFHLERAVLFSPEQQGAIAAFFEIHSLAREAV